MGDTLSVPDPAGNPPGNAGASRPGGTVAPRAGVAHLPAAVTGSPRPEPRSTAMPSPPVRPHALVLPLLLLAAGCAGGAPVTRDAGTVAVVTGEGYGQEVRRGPEVLNDMQVEAGPEEVWRVLPDVYAALGLSPDVQDPGARTLGVSEHRFTRTVLGRPASEFFDCGLDPGLDRPVADQVPVTAQVSTTVVTVGEATYVRTLVQGTARRTGGNAGIAACRSTGRMEARVAEMVRERTAGE